MNLLEQIINENQDKRICVVGTTCTGKSTLIKRLGFGLDMDNIIFPLLNVEETEYVNRSPWTPEIGEYMDKLVKEKIKIEKGNPVFGTVIIPSDIIIYLDIDDETLKERCKKRNADFENSNNMNNKIKSELSNTNVPIFIIKITTPKYIKDVEHVKISGMGHPIYSKSDVSVYFELPLLEAGIELYDKNIRSISNNTGDGNISKNSDIEIDFDTLNEENKEIANNLILQGRASLDKQRNNLKLSVETKLDDTVEAVKNKMLELVSNFQYQDILYGKYDFEQIGNIIKYLRKTYGEEIFDEYCSDNEISVNKVIKYLRDTLYMPNVIFDENDCLFWEHETYLKKHKEYELKQQKMIYRNI